MPTSITLHLYATLSPVVSVAFFRVSVAKGRWSPLGCADGRRHAACAVSKLQKNTRETENRTATVVCARRRIVVCVSGAASKNREKGSFVFFRPCGHWEREGGDPFTGANDLTTP